MIEKNKKKQRVVKGLYEEDTTNLKEEDEEISEEDTIYSNEGVEDRVEDDELSSTEAGFMKGYLES